VDFEDGWLIKSSFITKDEMKLVSSPGPNSHKKKKKNSCLLYRPWNVPSLDLSLAERKCSPLSVKNVGADLNVNPLIFRTAAYATVPADSNFFHTLIQMNGV
jgi:hypothetical protein